MANILQNGVFPIQNKIMRLPTVISWSIFLLCWAAAPVLAQSPEPSASVWHRAPKRVLQQGGVRVEVYDFEGFRSFLRAPHSDTTYVINWWATWCKPCVEELPHFAELARAMSDKPVKVLLVSMDFSNQLESRLLPFLTRQALPMECIALESANASHWIDQIDRDWSGAIPATLIYRGEQRIFYEQSFTLDELRTEVAKFITNP